MRWENLLIKFVGALIFSYSFIYIILRKLNALTHCVQSGACESTTQFMSGYPLTYVLLAAIGLTLVVFNFIKEK
jgi:Na+/citrate or Na+/malate symporter